jgi:sucrose phosphorylase
MKKTTDDLKQKLQKRLQFIYKNQFSESLLNDTLKIIDRYIPIIPVKESGWNQNDMVLITYGDSVKKSGEKPLQTLNSFCSEELNGLISNIHILPFFPYSSDDGFSIIDYSRVREDLGSWNDIENLAEQYSLMADLVINHVSAKSRWFQNFLQDKHPGKDYFIVKNPREDLSQVVRPRSTPLLTAFETASGKKYVWTTFSADQVDLNFQNPQVFLEILEILLGYLSKGIRIIRLDAIAFLWKKNHSTCLHLPETHEFVKLFRDLFNFISPHLVLLTETNVTNKENLSYFGDGDEAHMVYQFSMPPLLLHAFFSESALHFNEWASTLPTPPARATFLNFTASHDGIGVRPLEGILNEKNKKQLYDKIQSLGGMISTKTNPDGTESPYELNITYFDALRETRFSGESSHLQRFVSSQMVMAAFKGVPAFYIHSLLTTENDITGYQQTGRARSLNRKTWDYETLQKLLSSQNHHQKGLEILLKIIAIRKKQPAFHPEADQIWLDAGNDFICFARQSENQRIVHISNVTGSVKGVTVISDRPVTNLLTAHKLSSGYAEISLMPFESKWFAGQPNSFHIKTI